MRYSVYVIIIVAIFYTLFLFKDNLYFVYMDYDNFKQPHAYANQLEIKKYGEELSCYVDRVVRDIDEGHGIRNRLDSTDCRVYFDINNGILPDFERAITPHDITGDTNFPLEGQWKVAVFVLAEAIDNYDLRILSTLPIGTISIPGSTNITDISCLNSLPINDLSITGHKINSYDVLANLPLIHLTLEFHENFNVDMLKNIKTLKKVEFNLPIECFRALHGLNASVYFDGKKIKDYGQ